jgi:hypothetical protein
LRRRISSDLPRNENNLLNRVLKRPMQDPSHAVGFLVLSLLGTKRREARRDMRRLLMSHANAVAPVDGKGSSLFASLLSTIWPPTRANAFNIVAVIAAGAVVIWYNFQEKRSELSEQLMKRKRDKAKEGLKKLLADSKVAVVAKEGLDDVVEGLCADQDQIKHWPKELDGIKEHIKSTLQKEDGGELHIKETVAWHCDKANAAMGAKLADASDLAKHFVVDMLGASAFVLRAKCQFPEEFPEGAAELAAANAKTESTKGSGKDDAKKADGADGEEEETGKDKGDKKAEFSEEALKKAEIITKECETCKTWPKPFQDWMKGELKKEDGGKSLAEALLKHHTDKDKVAHGAKIPGTSDEVCKEILDVMLTGDFEAR